MNQMNYTNPEQIRPPIGDRGRSANQTFHDFRPGAFEIASAVDQSNIGDVLLNSSAYDTANSKSIIEAFDEHVLREQDVMHRIFRKRGARAREIQPSTADPTQANDTVVLQRLREEQIRAHTVAVDINAALRPHPTTELLRAIDCLQKAEIMNDFDKAVNAAEQAAQHSTVEEAEQAAAYGARDFHFGHIERTRAVLHDAEKPLEIISFLGKTQMPTASDSN